ncbi:MAG: hypothetical protein ACK4RS_08020, partial [Thiothrix sp.]
LIAGGGTPMAEAMLWAGSELLAVNRQRRILLVLTDGDYDSAMASAAIRALGRLSVECAGIGILHSGVAAIFPVHRAISDIDALPRCMFDLLLEMMRQGRHRH